MQCCKNGAFTLAPFTEPPAYLEQLFLGRGGEAREFQESIHKFNAAFAFTSIGCKLDEHLARSTGLQPFNIHGHLYHNIGPSGVADGATAAWAQLYLRDMSTVIEVRLRRNPDLDQRIIERLSQELHSCGNPFINRFKHAYERLMDEGRTNPDPLAVLQMDSLHSELIAGCYTRTENLSTTEEVVGIIPQVPADASSPLYRDIHVRLQANDTTGCNPNGLIQVHQSHPGYMPLAYVILFLKGDNG